MWETNSVKHKQTSPPSSILLRPSPLLDETLVSLSLLVVALVAQRLKVCQVVEPVGAYRPRFDMIHAGGGLDDALAPALRAQGMTGTEGPAQSRPSRSMVGIGGPFPDVAAITLLLSGRMVPW